MCLVSFPEHWGPLNKPERNPVAQKPLPCLWLLLTLAVLVAVITERVVLT